MNKKFFNGRRKKRKRKTRKKRGGTITDTMRARWREHMEKDRQIQIAWDNF